MKMMYTQLKEISYRYIPGKFMNYIFCVWDVISVWKVNNNKQCQEKRYWKTLCKNIRPMKTRLVSTFQPRWGKSKCFWNFSNLYYAFTIFSMSCPFITWVITALHNFLYLVNQRFPFTKHRLSVIHSYKLVIFYPVSFAFVLCLANFPNPHSLLYV